MGERTRSRIGTCEGVKTVRVYSANPKTADGYNTFIFRRDVARSLNKLAWAPVIDGSRNTIPEGIKIGDESVRYSADEKKRLLDFVERLANAQKGPVENDDFGRFEITKVFATEVQCHAISTRREIEAVSSAAEIARSMVHFVGSPNEELKRKKPNKYFEYGLAKIRLSDGVYLVMGEVGIRVNKRPYYDQRVVAKFKADSEVTSLHGQTQIGESAFERVYDNRFRLILQGVVMYYNTRSSNQTISNQTIKQSPRISFVIPVYKTPEQLLRNCLDSVLRYSQPMELICVLDSPGDPCEQVLDEYVAKEPRMRLLKNDQNRGVSYSRNRGMDAATGEYLAFVDADDEIIASGYEKAMILSMSQGLDGCKVTGWEDCSPRFGVPCGACVIGTLLDDKALFLAKVYLWAIYPTVLKLDMLRAYNLRFLEGHRFGEDFMFIVKVLCTGGRFGYLNALAYKGVGHAMSVTRSAPSAERYLHGLITAKHVLSDVINAGVKSETIKWYVKTVVSLTLFDRQTKRYVRDENRRRFEETLKQFAEILIEKGDGIITPVPHLLFRIVARAPHLWFFPGMPLMFLLRIFNHFGKVVRS